MIKFSNNEDRNVQLNVLYVETQSKLNQLVALSEERQLHVHKNIGVDGVRLNRMIVDYETIVKLLIMIRKKKS